MRCYKSKHSRIEVTARVGRRAEYVTNKARPSYADYSVEGLSDWGVGVGGGLT